MVPALGNGAAISYSLVEYAGRSEGRMSANGLRTLSFLVLIGLMLYVGARAI